MKLGGVLTFAILAASAVFVWNALGNLGPSGAAYIPDEPLAWYWIEQRGPGPSDMKIGERIYQTEADALALFERWRSAYPMPGGMLVLYRQEAGGEAFPVRLRGT